MQYIYIIRNILNNKVYIGQTKYPEKRWYQHKAIAASKGKTHQYIHKAIAKYGYQNFTFTVIDFGIDYHQTDCLERNYIIQYDSRNSEKGYNYSSGGYVGERSEETRKKISLSCKGKTSWMKGKKHKPESLLKLSIAAKGRVCSDDKKKYLAKLFAGRTSCMKGRKHSEETKKKMSDAQKGRKMSEEHKEKLKKLRTGTILSEVVREKISKTLLTKNIPSVNRKLTNEQVVAIRKMYNTMEKKSLRKVAKSFNVTFLIIQNIISGKMYKGI